MAQPAQGQSRRVRSSAACASSLLQPQWEAQDGEENKRFLHAAIREPIELLTSHVPGHKGLSLERDPDISSIFPQPSFLPPQCRLQFTGVRPMHLPASLALIMSFIAG